MAKKLRCIFHQAHRWKREVRADLKNGPHIGVKLYILSIYIGKSVYIKRKTSILQQKDSWYKTLFLWKRLEFTVMLFLIILH